jgi:predicted TIM-barrel fold metal-dependent hydrolase
MLPALIALEEHYDSGVFSAQDELHTSLPAHLHDSLHDLGQDRIKALDAGKIAIQVVSHIASQTPSHDCIAANDKLAAACKVSTKQLAAFAYLPMHDPAAAVRELERTVKDLGFVGALINNNADDGSFYDDEKYWPVFAKAVDLDVPIYIHPSYPIEASRYDGNFAPAAKIMMSASGWGWHSECGLHFLRLFASGLFDRYPTFKLIMGHMGEMVPYMLDRIANTSRHWGKFQRDLKTVWRENVWVTTSGLFTLPPFECLIKTTPIEHVMYGGALILENWTSADWLHRYSIDYPFSTTQTGLAFVQEIEQSKLLSNEQLEAFCHGNAEKLLGIRI